MSSSPNPRFVDQYFIARGEGFTHKEALVVARARLQLED